MNEWIRVLFIVACFVIAAIIFMLSQGCSSTEHRREALQREHPDCYVMEDLYIECPNPFTIDSSSAGFGTEVKNEKIKVKKRGKKNGNK